MKRITNMYVPLNLVLFDVGLEGNRTCKVKLGFISCIGLVGREYMFKSLFLFSFPFRYISPLFNKRRKSI